MSTSILQLVSNSTNDTIFSKKYKLPEITFFKFAYKSAPLFYKEERETNNININWGGNVRFKIDKNIHLLENMFLKVKIPYFKLNKTNITNTIKTIKNDILTKILYDDYDTYIYIIKENDILSYYLIPTFLFNNSLTDYKLYNISFEDLKLYLHEDIIKLFNPFDQIFLLNFSEENMINNIIPLLLKFGNILDQYYVNIIKDTDNNQLHKNILTSTSLNKYNTIILENELFRFNKHSENYDIFNEDIYFYYNIYKKKEYTKYNELYIVKSLYNYNIEQNTINEDVFLKNSIIETFNIFDYLLKRLYSNINNYNFYKNYEIQFDINEEFEMEFNENLIIPLNTAGVEILDQTQIPENKLFLYWPRYRINQKLLNFTITQNTIIETIQNNKINIQFINNNIIFEFIDLSEKPTLNQQKIILKVVNSKTSKNKLLNKTNEYVNSNNEWIDYLPNNLNKLNKNTKLNSYLFSTIKKKYFNNEGIIQNIFRHILIESDNITDLWINLRTLQIKFNKENELEYKNINDFYKERTNISNNFSSIKNIHLLPQDLYNTYLLVLNDFLQDIKLDILTDMSLFTIFYTNYFIYFYKRFITISNLYKSTNLFNGLMFYLNINVKNYINIELIKNNILELLNKKTFISYVNLDKNSIKKFDLKTDNISNISQTGTTKNNLNYFQELKIKTEYTISDFLIDDNKVIINKNLLKYYFYKDSLTTFNINVNNNIYKINDYNITKTNIIFNLENKLITNVTQIILQETTILSIPYINLSNTSEKGKVNECKKQIILDKINNIDKFNTFNNINISKTDTDYIDDTKVIYINYKKSNGNIFHIVNLKYNNNGTYKIISSEPLQINYNNFDQIELYFIELPITKVNIKNSDCIDTINNTYPYIKVKKSVIDTTIINNTIKVKINNKFVDTRIDSEDYYFDNNMNTYTEYLNILVINNDTVNLNNIDIYIYDNEYLPNLINYTTFGENTNNIVDLNSYFLQKPMLLQLNQSYDIPIFVFANIPYLSQNSTYYLNNTKLIFNELMDKWDLSSNQLVRYNKNNINLKYSLHYSNEILKNTNDKENIETLIVDKFNLLLGDTLYGKIINLIETSYDNYFNIFTNIITEIKNKNKFGITLNNLLEHLNNLNKFKTFNKSSYNIKIDNYHLIEYDIYSHLATNTFNTIDNNINNINYKFNNYVVHNMKVKFKNKSITLSPWLDYDSENKINKKIYDYLDKFTYYNKINIEYIEKNNDINKLNNLQMIDYKLNTQDKLLSNITKLLYNYNNFEITFDNMNYFNLFINNPKTSDIYTEIFYKGRQLNGIYDNSKNKIICNGTVNIMNEYTKIEYYKETKTLGNSNITSKTNYNLLGYINKKENKLILENSFSENFNKTDYIEVNNHIINKKKLSQYRLSGINNNCYSILTSSFTNVTGFKSLDIFYTSIKLSTDISLIKNKNYYIDIDNNKLLLLYKDSHIHLLSKVNIIFPSKLIFNYLLVPDNNSSLDIINNLDEYIVVFSNNTIIIDNYNIVNSNKFNWYNESLSIDTTKNYIFKLPKKYNSNKYNISDNIAEFYQFNNDLYLIRSYEKNNNDNIEDKEYTFKISEITRTLELPLNLNNNQIKLFNCLSDLDVFLYPDNWLSINNIEFQIKDYGKIISNINDTNSNYYIKDGSYLLYYCDGNKIPNQLLYLDLYSNKLENTNKLYYDPYKNEYIINKAFSQLNKFHKFFDIPLNNTSYKFYVYGTNNSIGGYYYPLSLIKTPHNLLLTFDEFPNTNFYIDKYNQNYDIDNLSENYFYLISYNIYGNIPYNNINFQLNTLDSLIINTDNNNFKIKNVNSSNHFIKNNLDKYEFTQDTNIPIISTIITEDIINGYNLQLSVTNFTLKYKSDILNENEGYINLYINGVKYHQIYSTLYHLNLKPGNNQIVAELVLLNNKILSLNNIVINNTKNINVTSVFEESKVSSIRKITTNSIPFVDFEIEEVNDKKIMIIDLTNFNFVLPTENISDNEGHGKLIINNKVERIYNLVHKLELDYGINKIRLELVDNTGVSLMNNGSLISKEITINNNGKLVFNSDSKIYNNTVIVLTNNSNNINRNLVIRNTKSYYNIKYKIDNKENDSLFVINTNQINSSSILLTNLHFNKTYHNISVNSNNKNLKIIKTDNLSWTINLENSNNYEITTDLNNIKMYKFIINLCHSHNKLNKEEVFIWLIISDIYPKYNLIETTKDYSQMVIEPIYLSTTISKTFTLEDNIEYDILSVNNKLLNVTITKSETIVTTKKFELITKYELISDKILSFTDINGYYEYNNFINKKNNYNDINVKENMIKSIKSHLNLWEYLDSIEINNIILKNYNYYIFIKDNKLYYNEFKNYDPISNSIQLKYNTQITNCDVFIYNFNPIFINLKFNYIIYNDHLYIYDIFGKLERNEIIKFNNLAVRILFYSNYYNSYVCEILLMNNDNFKKSSGYYSLGKFNNYYDRMYLLNNNIENNIDNKLYNSNNSELIYGDYYINKSNNLDYFKNNLDDIPDNILKFKKGIYINLLVIIKNDNTHFYYDSSCINLTEGMVLYFKGNNRYFTLIINLINNNELKFILNDIDYDFTSGELINVYIPIQPFIYYDDILYTIKNQQQELNINFTGFIEKINNNTISYIYINKSISEEELDIGYYRIYDLSKLSINCDFTNTFDVNFYQNLNNNNSKRILLKINNLSNGDIYLYNDKYNFNNLKYIFYQNIIVNNYLSKIINIKDNKIFIDNNIPFKINKNHFYTVLISSINEDYYTSNNNILDSNYFYKYPQINKSEKNNINIMLYSKQNNFNYNITDSIINNSYSINSEKLNKLKNMKVWTNNLQKLFYCNNFVPFYYNDKANFNFISLLPTINNNMNKFLVEEIYDNYRYIHFIEIKNVNGILKITSANEFKDINESTFYLNRVIPMRISKNNYIQLLKPDYIFNKNIVNTTSIENLNYQIYFNVNTKNNYFNTQPIKQGDEFKYKINISDDIYELIKNEKIYVSKIYMFECNLKKENNNIYLYSETLINVKLEYIFIITKGYIKEIKLLNKKLKEIFNNINDKCLIDKLLNKTYYKNQNIFNIDYTNNKYHLSFKNNNNNSDIIINNLVDKHKETIVDFDDLDGDFYINNNNKINTSKIKIEETDINSQITIKYNLSKQDILSKEYYIGNVYLINPQYKLYDISENLQKIGIYQKTDDSNYLCIKKELSTTILTMVDLLKDIGIKFNLVLYNRKPWELWSQLTLSTDSLFKNGYVYDILVYINRNLKTKTSLNLDLTNVYNINSINSIFMNSEINEIRDFMEYFYIVNPKDPFEEYNRFMELREIELFLYNEVNKLIKYEYFWDNITFIISELVKNYKATINSWIFYKGCIMTYNNNKYEVDEILPDGRKKEVLFNMNNDVYSRKYYLPAEFVIKYFSEGLKTAYYGNYEVKFYFIIYRDYNIINNELLNYINKKKGTVYGTSFDNIYLFLIELYNYKYKLEFKEQSEYIYILYGTSQVGRTKNKLGFYYPMSLKKTNNDVEYTFKEFPNVKFYLPKNNIVLANSNYPIDTTLINYNEITNVNYYNYYVYGTGNISGDFGYYYPLSLVSYGDDHPYTFVEFPNKIFYMKNNVTTQFTETISNLDNKLINYNLEF
uniref:Uncharacterized protein n=1 Tax=viral metagenome TaxID=1070528 RepID=A0A6C0J361_9ZZZZ